MKALSFLLLAFTVTTHAHSEGPAKTFSPEVSGLVEALLDCPAETAELKKLSSYVGTPTILSDSEDQTTYELTFWQGGSYPETVPNKVGKLTMVRTRHSSHIAPDGAGYFITTCQVTLK